MMDRFSDSVNFFVLFPSLVVALGLVDSRFVEFWFEAVLPMTLSLILGLMLKAASFEGVFFLCLLWLFGEGL